MLRLARPLVVALGALTSMMASAAEPPSWLVETMYTSGKINTVVAVVSVLIVGLATWMFLLDRKLRRMEEEMRNGRR